MLEGAETQDERAGKGEDIFIHEKDRGEERERERRKQHGMGQRTEGSRAESGVEGRKSLVLTCLGLGRGEGGGEGAPLSCFQSLMARCSAPPAPADSPLSVSLCD